MIKNRMLKDMLRKIYKSKRQADREIGVKINDFVQALHLQMSLKKNDRDEEVVKTCFENLGKLRRAGRFRNEFPSFPKFYNYIVNPKNNFTLEDIAEL